MQDLNEIQCFVKAVELKSLTSASKALGLPKSSVSRKIRSLEERLGMNLIVRTTRALNLTDSGRAFYEKSALALKEIETALENLNEVRTAVEGTLRMTASIVMATGPFNELLASFLVKYPRVKIDLVIGDRPVDLISEGFDFAFRIGTLSDSSLIAKKLKPIEANIFASPAYLKEFGTPKTFEELEKCELIGFAPNGESLPWSLKGPNGKKSLVKQGRLIVNHILSLKEAAVNGVGLALLPNYLVSEEVRDQKLKIVLSEWSAQSGQLHLVFPSQKFISPKMRAFLDHVNEHPFFGR